MIMIKLVIGDFSLNIIGAYALQIVLDKEDQKTFWEDLDEVGGGVSNTKKLFIEGDFNGHIESTPMVCSDQYGGFNFRDKNEEESHL